MGNVVSAGLGQVSSTCLHIDDSRPTYMLYLTVTSPPGFSKPMLV